MLQFGFVASGHDTCATCEKDIKPGQRVLYRLIHTGCSPAPHTELVQRCPRCLRIHPCGCL